MRRPFLDRGTTVKKFFKGKWIRQYGKSLQFRIFVIFMLVGIVPIMLIKQNLEKFWSRALPREGRWCRISVSAWQRSWSAQAIFRKSSEVAEMELSQLAGLYNGRIVIVERRPDHQGYLWPG